MTTHEHSAGVVSLMAEARARRRFRNSPEHSVLVVEPEDSEALLLERLVTRSGDRVCRAADDESGLDLVLDLTPDVIILSDGVTGGAVTFIQTVHVMYAGKALRPRFVVLLPAGRDLLDPVSFGMLSVEQLHKPILAAELIDIMSRQEASAVAATPSHSGDAHSDSVLAQLRMYEDPAFIERFLQVSLQDIDRAITELDAQAFKPDASRIWHLVHGIHGLSMNIDAHDLARACKGLLQLPRDEIVPTWRPALVAIKKLFARTRNDLATAHGRA